MKCPHCRVSFHDNQTKQPLYYNGRYSRWDALLYLCPECEKLTIFIEDDSGISKMVEPIFATRAPVPASVPQHIRRDYEEACQVLIISPKASAALSRRCLQNILNDQGYKAKDLAKQIDAVLNENDARKSLSASFHSTIDAVRNFGNFSAHPIDEKTTLQIIDVEPEEAEWCLEILGEMFEHFFEKPTLAAAKKAALNAKLSAAGKPAAK